MKSLSCREAENLFLFLVINALPLIQNSLLPYSQLIGLKNSLVWSRRYEGFYLSILGDGSLQIQGRFSIHKLSIFITVGFVLVSQKCLITFVKKYRWQL